MMKTLKTEDMLKLIRMINLCKKEAVFGYCTKNTNLYKRQ